MSLLAYNKTAAPLVLAAGSPVRTLPAAPSAGAKSAAFDVTAELRGLSSGDYALLQAQVAADQLFLHWTSEQEYLTDSLAVGFENITIYVDATLGDDNNVGSLASPVQTFERALELVPNSWKGTCTIDMAEGSYSVVQPDGRLWTLNNPTGTIATPLQFLGKLSSEVVTGNASPSQPSTFDTGPFTTADVGSTTTVINLVGGALAVNSQVGNVVFTGPGFSFSESRTIISNTANSYTLEYPLSVVPSSGDGVFTAAAFVENTALAPAVDAYRGAFVSFTSGANAGQRRMIVSNTNAGKFQVNVGWQNAIAADDTFVIEKPTVTLVNDIGDFAGWASRYRVGYKGINFLSGAGNILGPVDGGQMQIEACTYNASGGSLIIQHRAAEIQGESFPIVWGNEGPGNPFSFNRLQAGMYVKNASVYIANSGNLQGYFVMDDCYIAVWDSQIELDNPSLLRCAIEAHNSFINLSGGENGVRGSLSGSNGFSSAITITDNSTLLATHVDVSGAQYNGIEVSSDGFANLLNVRGSLNGSQGISAVRMGSVRYNTTGSNGATTITGTGGDFNIGNSGSFTYAQLAGVSDTDAGGSTTTVINLTTGGLTVDSQIGLTLQVGIETRPIIANTANTITVASPLSVAPTAGAGILVLSSVGDGLGNRITSYSDPFGGA